MTRPREKLREWKVVWQDGSKVSARGGVRLCLGGAGREGQCIRLGCWAVPGSG